MKARRWEDFPLARSLRVVIRKSIMMLEDFIEDFSSAVFIDLGCGDGFVLEEVSPYFGRCAGVECNLELAHAARMRLKNVAIFFGDMIKIDLKSVIEEVAPPNGPSAVVFYAYLTTKLLEKMLPRMIEFAEAIGKPVYLVSTNHPLNKGSLGEKVTLLTNKTVKASPCDPGCWNVFIYKIG